MHFVFMGVSGSGKSTVASRVAKRLELPFAEADLFHPPENIAKMSSGVPLTDEDRRPWLRALARWIGEHDDPHLPTVMACSALKRSYRDILRGGAPDVVFVHLDGPTEVVAARLRERTGHFMPTDLLRSQAAILEPLARDEAGTTLDLGGTLEDLLEESAAFVRDTVRSRGGDPR